MLCTKCLYLTVLISMLLFAQQSKAQDVIPLQASLQFASERINPMHEVSLGLSVEKFAAAIPETFEGIGDNTILDNNLVLYPFFDKLKLAQARICLDSIRVLHLGDSHIKGHFFTRKIGDKLAQAFPKLAYQDFGINGATAKTFLRSNYLQIIKESQADLIILSFGTNESHNLRYNARIHYAQLDELISSIRTALPDVPLLLTAPPGSYEGRGRRSRRIYKVNPRTEQVAQLIKKYARENHLAFWDLYSVVGGRRYACDNWSKASMFRPDHIHYLPEGYELQADIFCEALINAYNEYISL